MAVTFGPAKLSPKNSDMHEIIINFQTDRNDGAYIVHALHVDAKTVLSHWRPVESWAVLLKVMRYLGATEEQIACFEDDNRRWSRGSVHIRLLPDRKNLLGIDFSKL
jgi:hypothetical protein